MDHFMGLALEASKVHTPSIVARAPLFFTNKESNSSLLNFDKLEFHYFSYESNILYALIFVNLLRDNKAQENYVHAEKYRVINTIKHR